MVQDNSQWPVIADDEINVVAIGRWASDPEQRYLRFLEERAGDLPYSSLETRALRQVPGAVAVIRQGNTRVVYGDVNATNLDHDREEIVADRWIRDQIVTYLRSRS